ncbi:MAG: hypothetical protein UHJ46_01415 [Treponema sp.]|nr:hypothetical protein [Treponema sp.]
MKNIYKNLLVALFCSVILFLTSCKSQIKITFSKNACTVKYSTKLGKALFDTFYAFAGETESERIFDTEQFKQIFSEGGLKNVSAESKVIDEISIQGDIDGNNGDFISGSSIIKSSNNGKNVEIEFSRNNLLKMYDNMPSIMRSYIDLFMAPVFTEEEMSNEEYLELISSVYGQILADEIKTSTVDFIVVLSDGKTKQFSLELIDLINIKTDIKKNF